MRLVGIAVATLLMTACSGGDEQPGTVTADEARQLNEAADMLDANSVDLNALSSSDRAATDQAATGQPADDQAANDQDPS